MLKRLIVILFCCSLLGCKDRPAENSSPTAAPQESVSAVSVDQLIHEIALLEPWENAPYSKQGINQLVKTARLCQKSPPQLVREALYKSSSILCKEFINGEPSVFLLLRMMFDLPHQAPQMIPGMIGWMWTIGPQNDDKTFDLSWPLIYQDGHFKIISRLIGYRGPGLKFYDPVADYDYMVKHYQFRKLD